MVRNQDVSHGNPDVGTNVLPAKIGSTFSRLQQLYKSGPLTVAFWGLGLLVVAFILQDGAWAGVLGVWGTTLFLLGATWHALVSYVRSGR